MDRTRLSYILFVILLLCLGIALGFWITGLMTSAPVVPKTPTTKTAKHAPFVFPAGFCCTTPGSACTSQSGGALVCLHQGGKIFNRNQKSCDTICAHFLKKS